MKVYRIQPVGLDVSHCSETSNGNAIDLHVFDSPLAAIQCEENPTVYGEEVVELEVDRVWDNGDVEGVACDGSRATVTQRWTLDEFAKFAAPEIADLTADEIDCTLAYESCPHWFAARKTI